MRRKRIHLTLLACLSVFVLLEVSAEDGPRTPKELVGFLTYESGRRFSPMMTCGAVYSDALEDEQATRSLVDLGAEALPELNRALDALSTTSAWRFGAGWLLAAYARIEGAAALPRLRKMIGTSVVDPWVVDSAIAISFGLTSYVSSARERRDTFTCYRPEEPREALDNVIAAWGAGDTSWLERNLGQRAKASLAPRAEGPGWMSVKAGFTDGDARPAVGYRFEISGPWSQPWLAEPLREAWGEAKLSKFPRSLAISTVFVDGRGQACGKRVVEFAQDGGPMKYVVDAPEPTDLLRLIEHCAEQDNSGAR